MVCCISGSIEPSRLDGYRIPRPVVRSRMILGYDCLDTSTRLYRKAAALLPEVFKSSTCSHSCDCVCTCYQDHIHPFLQIPLLINELMVAFFNVFDLHV